VASLFLGAVWTEYNVGLWSQIRREISYRWVSKNLKGAAVACLRVLFRHAPGQTTKTMKIHGQGCWWHLDIYCDVTCSVKSNYIHGQFFWRSWESFSWSRNFPSFTEPENVLPCSQQSTICPHPEAGESNLHPSTPL